MSEQDKEQPDGEKKIQRASERKRAYRIRKKPEDQRTDDEKSWYANYEATKQRTSPTDAEPDAMDDDVPSNDAMGDDKPPAPPPPPPPRVEYKSASADAEGPGSKSGAGGDWRRKYQAKHSGREQTVLAIATQWRHALEFLSSQIVMSGGVPMVNLNDLWPHIVITVDDVLPERVSLKSSHLAAAGTTVLLGQRIARNKLVGEAYARGQTTNPAVEPTVPDPAHAATSPTGGAVGVAPAPAAVNPVQSNAGGQEQPVAESLVADIPVPTEPFIKLADNADEPPQNPGEVF